MKSIAAVLGMVVSLSVFGQITITDNDFPQSGFTYLVHIDTTTAVALGTPGPSAQSWNFSGLQSQDTRVPTYGSTSWTPYAAAFSASNLYTYGPAALFGGFAGGAPVGSQGMNNGYMFWKSAANGFWIVGFRADSGAYSNQNVLENPMELLIGAPATYGSSFNNTGRWVLPMNLNSMDLDTFYVNRVEKTLDVDAWGSLDLPSTNYPSVIRYHEHLVRYDSVYARMGSTLVYSLELNRDTLNNYIYMANGVHYPLAIVHADVNNTITSVEYYFGYLASVQDENSVQQEGTVYPNPVVNNSVIELPEHFSLNGAVISYYDVSGRLCRKENANGNIIDVNANDFENGIYTYQVVNAEGSEVHGKITVAK